MPDKKHYVFSARTTEEGLRILNGLRKERGVSWDELVLDAVCTHYGLDRDVMAIPKQPKAEGQGKRKSRAGTIKRRKAKEETSAGV